MNFPDMESTKHMSFLVQLVEDYGFVGMIDQERGRDGDMLPIMYPFGYPSAKSSAIRFKKEELATEALWSSRSNGTINYHGPEGAVCKVRVVSGYDGRTFEQKTIEFQLRKLRSSVKYHQVPEKTWRTDLNNKKHGSYHKESGPKGYV